MEMCADENNQFYPASRDLLYVASPDHNPVWTEMDADATASPPIGLSDWFNALPPYAGGNIVFSDAHAAYFKYNYVVALIGGKIADPKAPDINWEFDGQ